MHIDTLFDSVKKQVNNTHPSASLTIPDTWAQGRTVYGGMSASLIYMAMRQLVNPDKHLRSLNTSFVGPIEPDVPFEIKIQLLREGKNTAQFYGQLIQNDKVCVAILAGFGHNRPSKVSILNETTHAMKLPKKANFIPMLPKITPSYMRHIDLAKHHGGWPFTGSQFSDVQGWMRLKHPPEKLTVAHLIALIDVWPPTVLQTLRWPAPASTMSWNLEFIYPHDDFAADEWFAYQATTRHAADGYMHSEANIWDAKGSLIAISRQNVTVFA